MELVEVLGKDPGPPPTYHVIFRVVADHGRHSCPSWLTEKLIYRACPPPADRGAKRLRAWQRTLPPWTWADGGGMTLLDNLGADGDAPLAWAACGFVE